MARMIPSIIAPETNSDAERKIFKWFKEAKGTEDWIVLHSLGIATHPTVMFGETDFFILVPGCGLCALEIKGGEVDRKGGIWLFTNRYGETTEKVRGPFDQAKDGSFAIVDYIKRKLDIEHKNLENIFFTHGVMFPDTKFKDKLEGPEELVWQVFDCTDGTDVVNYIKNLFLGAQELWTNKYGKTSLENKIPDKEDVDYVAFLLRGDFDKPIPLKLQMKDAYNEIKQLTHEQYNCLDQLEDNSRCLILGGAGTGKTLLALQDVQRSVALGLRVALFCYNKNLAEWFKQYFCRANENLKPKYIGTFHSYMLNAIKTVKNNHYSTYDDEDFFKKTLPNDFSIVCNDYSQFDKLVIDEAQDLISEEYLKAMNIILAGGMVRGKWSMYGDFSNQAIYTHWQDKNVLIDLFDKNNLCPTHFKLTKNLRNTEQIYNELVSVTGNIGTKYATSHIPGPKVDHLPYKDQEEQKEKLVKCISRLLDDEQVKKHSFTILSPLQYEKSVVSKINEFEIKKYDPNNVEGISFSTIQAFKGLESNTVILTDIESFADKQLLYVAISRARTLLIVSYSKGAEVEYYKLLEGWIKSWQIQGARK